MRWANIAIVLVILTACQPQPVPTPAATPTAVPTAKPASLIGRPIKDAARAEVYLLTQDGHTRLIKGLPVFNTLDYQFQDIVTIPREQLRAYPPSMPLTRWLTGTTDHNLYLIEHGQRYKIDARTLAATGGREYDVSLVPDNFLNSYPVATTLPEMDGINRFADLMQVTSTRASLWSNNSLWLARSDGSLIRWDSKTGKTTTFDKPTNIETLASVGQNVVGTSTDGLLWSFDGTAWTKSPIAGRVPAITTVSGAMWYADVNYYDTQAGRYHIGRGLIRRDQNGSEQIFTLDVTENDPLRNITALVAQGDTLWIGTRFSGLLQFDTAQQVWKRFNTLNSDIPDNDIHGVSLGPDGSLWIASDTGISHLSDAKFESFAFPDDGIEQAPLKLLVRADNSVWTAGDNFVAQLKSDKTWQVYSPFTDTAFLDQWHNIIDDGNIWVVGNQRVLRWDGKTWTGYDVTNFAATLLPAAKLRSFDLPSPQTNYQAWLQAWPRPAQDDGYCVHYLATPTSETFELYQQIARLQALKIRWLVVNYTERSQLFTMAPAFAKAGIMVIWRPFVRPYENYLYWADDVKFLRGLGIPPYIQIYNEPSLGQEWEDAGKTVDQAVYLQHLLPAIKQVYDSGGFVGLQELDLDWLRTVLTQMKTQGLSDAWNRMFFVSHSYGYNRPPEFDGSFDTVLNFRDFAQVFQSEIGFVPMTISGEGGWRPGEKQDPRFPMVTQTLQRDYLLSVYSWFSTGKLSNGEPLPDYFFAYCPWILSDPTDPAAWYDSTSGDRQLVIQGIENLPPSIRHFSWEGH